MPVKIFFCYAREDEPLLNKFKTHLRLLQREGLIEVAITPSYAIMRKLHRG